jgi:hypothetical protein
LFRRTLRSGSPALDEWQLHALDNNLHSLESDSEEDDEKRDHQRTVRGRRCVKNILIVFPTYVLLDAKVIHGDGTNIVPKPISDHYKHQKMGSDSHSKFLLSFVVARTDIFPSKHGKVVKKKKPKLAQGFGFGLPPPPAKIPKASGVAMFGLSSPPPPPPQPPYATPKASSGITPIHTGSGGTIPTESGGGTVRSNLTVRTRGRSKNN